MRDIQLAKGAAGSERLIHSELLHENGMKTCHLLQTLCSCDFLNLGAFPEKYKSSYINVYETKVEANLPYFCCCVRMDNVLVVYFDVEQAKYQEKAGLCKPCCTHNHCCPTCFDMCGEGVVLHGDTLQCLNKRKLASAPFAYCQSYNPCTPCRPFVILPFVTDASKLAGIIGQAQKSAADKVSQGMLVQEAGTCAPPQQQTMGGTPPAFAQTQESANSIPVPVEALPQEYGNSHMGYPPPHQPM